MGDPTTCTDKEVFFLSFFLGMCDEGVSYSETVDRSFVFSSVVGEEKELNEVLNFVNFNFLSKTLQSM